MNDPYSSDAVVVKKPKGRSRRTVALSPHFSATALAATAFRGADLGRRETKDWSPEIHSPQSEIASDLDTLRLRSADLSNNCPEAIATLFAYDRHVVGCGLRPQCVPKLEMLPLSDPEISEFQAKAERLFEMWAEDAEKRASYDKSATFWTMQRQVLRSRLSRGDCFIIPKMADHGRWPFELSLQILEADRVGTPSYFDDVQQDEAGRVKEVGGVRFNVRGEATAYHVYDTHPGNSTFGSTLRGKWKSARNSDGTRRILHIFEAARPGQPRGIPVFASILEKMRLGEEYDRNEVIASVISSLFTVFVKSETGEGLDEPGDPFTQTVASEPGDYRLGPGAILDLCPTDSVQFADPQRPSKRFSEFRDTITRFAGMSVDVPFEVLAMQFRNSYSASRASLLRSWMTWYAVQKWIVTEFCQPIWERFIDECVAKGYLKVRGYWTDPFTRWAITRTKWSGPVPISLDPLKEAKASETNLANEISSLADEIGYRGGDWEQTMSQRAREMARRQELGLPGQRRVDAMTEPTDEQPTQEEIDDE